MSTPGGHASVRGDPDSDAEEIEAEVEVDLSLRGGNPAGFR